eukprot:symbB.v1.2.019387.t1/scaffold1572.1/size111004/3
MASTSKRRQTAFAGIAGNQEIDVPDDESGSAEPDLTALEKKLQDLHEMIETRFEEQMKILKTVKNSRSSEGAESSNRDEVESQAQTESIGDGQELKSMEHRLEDCGVLKEVWKLHADDTTNVSIQFQLSFLCFKTADVQCLKGMDQGAPRF